MPLTSRGKKPFGFGIPIIAGLIAISIGVLISFEIIKRNQPPAINHAILDKAEFDSSGRAFIYNGSNWILINRKGQVLISGIASMDNGPDYVRNGLIRFIEEGKWGYANIEGRKIIPAKYDGALPFENGVAWVCIGCKLKEDGEHHLFDGGNQFKV